MSRSNPSFRRGWVLDMVRRWARAVSAGNAGCWDRGTLKAMLLRSNSLMDPIDIGE